MGKVNGVDTVPEELSSESTPPNGADGEIRIGDKVFKSVEELSDAYRDAEANRRALSSVIGRQGREMGELRNGGTPPPPPDDDLGIPVEVFTGFEAEFVESPEKAVRNLARTIVKTTEERIGSRLERQLSSREVIERFWDSYFDKNDKHLEIEAYVRMEGDRMAKSGALNGMNKDEQIVAISRRIDTVGSKVFGGGVSTRDVPDKRVVNEPGKGSGATNRTPAPKEKPKTFMDEFREVGYRKSAV